MTSLESVPPATIIDGKALAGTTRERVRREVAERRARGAVQPGLATVLVGDDHASQVYVGRKRAACEEVGIASFHHELPAEVERA